MSFLDLEEQKPAFKVEAGKLPSPRIFVEFKGSEAGQSHIVSSVFRELYPQCDQSHSVGPDSFSTNFYTGDELKEFWNQVKKRIAFPEAKTIELNIDKQITAYLKMGGAQK